MHPESWGGLDSACPQRPEFREISGTALSPSPLQLTPGGGQGVFGVTGAPGSWASGAGQAGSGVQRVERLVRAASCR